MRKTTAKIRGLGFIVWHARHELYHILLGLVWAWFLRELWQEFNFRWVVLAIFGSLLPDAEHILYFLSYGKSDTYTKDIVDYIKKRQWRVLTAFIETGHKYNTNLAYHNFYTVCILGFCIVCAFVFDWRSLIVFIGAMVIHYLFDIADDIVTLGYINENWKRWGKGTRQHS